MSFTGIMLAVCCGILMYDIIASLLKAGIHALDRKIEQWKEEDRKSIGFGDCEVQKKKQKGAQMRKIGFGAND